MLPRPRGMHALPRFCRPVARHARALRLNSAGGCGGAFPRLLPVRACIAAGRARPYQRLPQRRYLRALPPPVYMASSKVYTAPSKAVGSFFQTRTPSCTIQAGEERAVLDSRCAEAPGAQGMSKYAPHAAPEGGCGKAGARSPAPSRACFPERLVPPAFTTTGHARTYRPVSRRSRSSLLDWSWKRVPSDGDARLPASAFRSDKCRLLLQR